MKHILLESFDIILSTDIIFVTTIHIMLIKLII
jgi:hypothetical protein